MVDELFQLLAWVLDSRIQCFDLWPVSENFFTFFSWQLIFHIMIFVIPLAMYTPALIPYVYLSIAQVFRWMDSVWRVDQFSHLSNRWLFQLIYLIITFLGMYQSKWNFMAMTYQSSMKQYIYQALTVSLNEFSPKCLKYFT